MTVDDRKLVLGCFQLLAGSILIAGAAVAEAAQPQLEESFFALCAGAVLLGMGFVSTFRTFVGRRLQQPKAAQPSPGERRA